MLFRSSATHRENLHGHNFAVYVSLTGEVAANAMLADYEPFKKVIIERCRSWNEVFLLPGLSPHLKIERDAKGNVLARFQDEELRFLARDVRVLPMENVSLEELARLLGEGLVGDGAGLRAQGISQVVVKCASEPGQWCSWSWSANG